MPGPEPRFFWLDFGFATWIAMLKMDHRFNNPVGLTFADLLIDELHVRRAALRLRHALTGDAPAAVRRLRWLRALQRESRRRWLRARNRWQLARLLLGVCELRELRKHRLDRRAVRRLRGDRAH